MNRPILKSGHGAVAAVVIVAALACSPRPSDSAAVLPAEAATDSAIDFDCGGRRVTLRRESGRWSPMPMV